MEVINLLALENFQVVLRAIEEVMYGFFALLL
jgi:hypothetical protein